TRLLLPEIRVVALAISLAATAAAVAQQPGDAKPKAAPKARARTPVFIPAADLKWTDLDPKRAFGAYLKLPAGFATPLHTHTYEMKVVFVSGMYIQAPEGKPEVRLCPAPTCCSRAETTGTPRPATRPPIVCSSWKAAARSI